MVNGGQWRPMEVNGGQWRSMETNRDQIYIYFRFYWTKIDILVQCVFKQDS